MSPLTDAFNGKKTHRPSKSPQTYMKEFKEALNDMVNNENPIIRKAICSHQYCPTKMLTERLQVEDDFDVIKTIILNKKTSLTAIEEFAKERPEVAAQFDASILTERQQQVVDDVEGQTIKVYPFFIKENI